MKEIDYILVDNKARITIALNALSGCSTGDECGISEDNLLFITKTLAEAQIRLFEMIETETDE
jgi:hypothetical protein